jgi:hypothetical protein
VEEAIPLPPPATTGEATAAGCGGGDAGTCETCGSGRDSTRPTGAGTLWLAGIEPVTSLWLVSGACSPKRPDSTLHPAIAIAINASATARGHVAERINSTRKRMSLTRTQQEPGDLTDRR